MTGQESGRPENEPRSYVIVLRVLDLGPAGEDGRIPVRVLLSCGCEAERRVPPGRLIELENPGGAPEPFLPGKFVCTKHGFDPPEPG